MHLRDALVSAILTLTHPSVPAADAQRRAAEYAPIVLRECRELDPFLVVALAGHESAGFRPWKRGPAGEVGLMQILPRAYPEIEETSLHDPAVNIRLGCERMRRMQATCHGRPTLEWLGKYPGNRRCAPTKYAGRVLALLRRIAGLRPRTT